MITFSSTLVLELSAWEGGHVEKMIFGQRLNESNLSQQNMVAKIEYFHAKATASSKQNSVAWLEAKIWPSLKKAFSTLSTEVCSAAETLGWILPGLILGLVTTFFLFSLFISLFLYLFLFACLFVQTSIIYASWTFKMAVFTRRVWPSI